MDKKAFFFLLFFLMFLVGCSNDTVDDFAISTNKPSGIPSQEEETPSSSEKIDATYEMSVAFPDGYNYEKLRTDFFDFLIFESWFRPSDMPQEEYELTYEIYRPQRKEGMKDVVNEIWIRCLMGEDDSWYSCYALTNGKWADWTGGYHFEISAPLENNDALVCLGKDTIIIPTVAKPNLIEDKEHQNQKEQIYDLLKDSVKNIYEQLLEEGYSDDLEIELVVSDFSIEKGFMPYSYLLINDEEVFECQFEVGVNKNDVYANYYNAFGVNYTIDWELSWEYATGNVWVFDGNQIKPLDEADKLAMERIKESAVFQYSYSGIEK